MGTRIKQERLARHWTQQKLGVLSRLPTSTICALENGYAHPWPAWRRRLARAFKLPQSVLFGEIAPKQSA
jgi:transcriptional regulator with XRE-family HTH domain